MTCRWALSVIGHDAADAPRANFKCFLATFSRTNAPRTLLSRSRKRMSCTHMKAHVSKLRRILRPVVRESTYRHDPLLINSLAAFNFRPPIRLEFPGERLARTPRSRDERHHHRAHQWALDDRAQLGALGPDITGTKVIASLPRTGLAWKATLNNFAVIRAASPHSD